MRWLRRFHDPAAPRLRGVLAAVGALVGLAAGGHAAAQNIRITNTAHVEFVHHLGDPDRAVSNTHEFEVVTDFEPGQMSILRRAVAGGGERLQVAPARYSATGLIDGQFTPAPAP